MKTMNTTAPTRECKLESPSTSPYTNPYARENATSEHRNPVVRAGMSVVEMVVWIVIMAALALGMIWLLWNTTR